MMSTISGHVRLKGQFFWKSKILMRSYLGKHSEELSNGTRINIRRKRTAMETPTGGIVLREFVMSR
jgi:hypothetical protein